MILPSTNSQLSLGLAEKSLQIINNFNPNLLKNITSIEHFNLKVGLLSSDGEYITPIIGWYSKRKVVLFNHPYQGNALNIQLEKTIIHEVGHCIIRNYSDYLGIESNKVGAIEEVFAQSFLPLLLKTNPEEVLRLHPPLSFSSILLLPSRLSQLDLQNKNKNTQWLKKLPELLPAIQESLVHFWNSISEHPQHQRKQHDQHSSQTPVNQANSKVSTPPTPNITPLPSKFKHKNKINLSKTNERKNNDLGGGAPSNNNIGGSKPSVNKNERRMNKNERHLF